MAVVFLLLTKKKPWRNKDDLAAGVNTSVKCRLLQSLPSLLFFIFLSFSLLLFLLPHLKKMCSFHLCSVITLSYSAISFYKINSRTWRLFNYLLALCHPNHLQAEQSPPTPLQNPSSCLKSFKVSSGLILALVVSPERVPYRIYQLVRR